MMVAECDMRELTGNKTLTLGRRGCTGIDQSLLNTTTGAVA